MDKDRLVQIKEICATDNSIGLLYMFGSRATNTAGPMSDYDFAIYFSISDKSTLINKRLFLITELSRILSTDNIDLVVLNEPISPELKYSVIKDGQLIFEREPYKITVEPKIMNEYFDFRSGLLRFGLTKKIYVE